MTRVHDMGGRFGDGPVTPEGEDVIFHAEWHRRALALTLATGTLGKWNIDVSRHARECLAPTDYMRFSYYEKWLAGVADMLVARGVVSREELAGKADPAPSPLAEKAMKAPQVADWQTIPLQAIADVVIRLDSMENAQEVQDSVLRNFSLFAEPFQRAFMEMAEVANVSERLNQCMLSVLDGDEISLAALRGLSCETKNDTIYTQLVSHFEAKKLNRLDILSVIAARHFQQMDEKLLLLFFEAVAEVDNQENYNGDVFRGFFSDLVQVPQLRELVLGILRTPERSDLLASAIGTLFSQTKG